MENPTKWWLICEEDVQKIREALDKSIRLEFGQSHLFSHRYLKTTLRDALHWLDTGLNTTDAVTDDFKVISED